MSEKKPPTRFSPNRPSAPRREAGRPVAGGLLGTRLPLLTELWRKSRKLDWHRPSAGGLGGEEIAAAGAALLALQRGLTGSRSLAGSGYMDDSDLLGAYLLYYWPVSYMQVSLALAERPFYPRRVLDLGSGPGPASAAVLDAARSRPHDVGLDRLVLVDSSRKALDLAKAILDGGARGSASVETLRLDLESGAALPEGPFDLIVAGHCLNELWSGEADAHERRLGLAQRAAERLAPGGRLLLLEPALLATSRALIALRDGLASRSWRVLGPCPGSYSCPAYAAGPDRSCHAESPWLPPSSVAALAKAAGLDRNSAKFAYFLLVPPLEPHTNQLKNPPADQRYEQESAAADRRVVSEGMVNKAGRLRYILCGGGRLETLSARADDAEARGKGFMDLRRGDVIRAVGLESRQGGGFGLLPGSSLELKALAPEAST